MTNIKTDDPPQRSLPLPASAVRRLLLSHVRRAGSFTELARRVGVSGPMIHAVLRGRATPGPKILGYLGLEARVMYFQVDPEVEIDPKEEVPGVREYYGGVLMDVVDASRTGWWRYHEGRDRDGYCDNPGRGY